MSEWAPKRFWKAAEVTDADAGFSVTLDGRPVRTPAKAPLILPTRAMAAAIAAEWDAQIDKVDPFTMPVTRSANAAIDKVAIQHAEVADMLAAYGDSDLLCYRAESPQELADLEAAHWDPLLHWAAEALSVRLETRKGIMHLPQAPEAIETLRGKVHALTPFELAAFHDLVSLSGSLVLAFAAIQDHLPPEEIWTMSRLDEIWQEEFWGVDEEAQEMANRKRNAFLHAHRFYLLANAQPKGVAGA